MLTKKEALGFTTTWITTNSYLNGLPKQWGKPATYSVKKTFKKQKKKTSNIKHQKPFSTKKQKKGSFTSHQMYKSQWPMPNFFGFSLKNYGFLIKPYCNTNTPYYSVQRHSPTLTQMERYTTSQFHRNWIVSPDVPFARSCFTRKDRRFTRIMK